jgi:CRP/FNR family transcriptional regulator
VFSSNLLSFPTALSEKAVSKLNSSAKLHSFEKGETIVHKGQKIGGAYLVQSGILRIYTMDSNGNEKPIYNLSQGEICIFSINCIFTKVVYPAWVTIDSPEAKILSIPTSTFKYLYENESAVKEFVFNSMSQRIFDLMSSIEEITLYDVDYRINSFLVRSCPENQILQLSHQDIASTLGTAREVVSRHLKDLEKQGYIKLSRMNIKILLPEALANISPK